MKQKLLSHLVRTAAELNGNSEAWLPKTEIRDVESNEEGVGERRRRGGGVLTRSGRFANN